MMKEQSRPLWHKIVAGVLLVVAVLLIVVYRNRIGSDFNPPDRSFVGPNLVAAVIQGGFIFMLVVLFYPPFQRAVHRFADNKLDLIHGKLDVLKTYHEAHAAKLAALVESHEKIHQRLDRLQEHHEQHAKKLDQLLARGGGSDDSQALDDSGTGQGSGAS
jgi:hypothetical protein